MKTVVFHIPNKNGIKIHVDQFPQIKSGDKFSIFQNTIDNTAGETVDYIEWIVKKGILKMNVWCK